MGNKMRQKKGLFFTAVALIIVTILVLTFSPPRPLTLADEVPAIEARANLANEHTKAVANSYVPLAVRVSAHSAFAALAEFLQEKNRQGMGKYFATTELFNLSFREAMLYGTVCCDMKGPPAWPACDSDIRADVLDMARHIGVDECLGKNVMAEKNLSVLLERIENVSFVALRINTSLGLYDPDDLLAIRFFQDNSTGPWQVGVNVTINYSVGVGDVSINNSRDIPVMFSIRGIPDPLYAVESWYVDEDGDGVTGSAGDADELIYTSYFNATNMTLWNVSSFYRQVEGRFYRHKENASSFLMRFYGIDEPSQCCGVESIINPFVMETVNGMVEKPYVDWCYYGINDRCTYAETGSLWNITCITDPADVDGTRFYRLAISSYHASTYNVTDYLYGLDPDAGGPGPACTVAPFP